MKQSKALIFVKSENSLSSIWCKYELNFFYELQKPIFIIEKDSIINKDFELKTINDYWFIDSDYKESTLILHQRFTINAYLFLIVFAMVNNIINSFFINYYSLQGIRCSTQALLQA